LNEGKVSQEAVDKVTKEFNFELEKLRTELEQQKKERISVDASKRTLDLQLSSLRDQVEQEERGRKKIEVSKKALQLELDDIKLLADEAEETKEEIDRLRKEHEQYKKELSNEREKEKKLQDIQLVNKLRNTKLKLRKLNVNWVTLKMRMLIT